tara:strand:- start:186 stop:881 length:696 start_codon:yes stop_codon:yes gene_type:complete
MSKIALTPDVDGTGTLSIVSPNTNTNRTLTLPDADLNLGNVLTTASSVDAANLTGVLPAISGAALTNLPIPASAVTLISTVSITTTVSSVNFSIPSGYTHYSVVMNRINGTANNTVIAIRTSTNGGSSFDSGASDYRRTSVFSDSIAISSVDNGYDKTYGGVFTDFFFQQTPSGYFSAHGMYQRTDGTYDVYGTWGSSRVSTATVNAFQIVGVGGNLTGGYGSKISFYGWT